MTIQKKQNKTKQLAVIAMFCALAYVCMLVIKIPVQFLTLDIKDAVIILCGLIFGPISAVAISLIVPLIEFATISGTGHYGLIMNILSSLSFSLVASLIYKYKKTFFGAIMALISGALAMVAVMMVANLLITPYFTGWTVAEVAAYIPKLLLPFNAVKATLNLAIVLLLYKPISNVLKKIGIIEKSGLSVAENTNNKRRNLIVTVISAVIIVLSFVVIFFILKV